MVMPTHHSKCLHKIQKKQQQNPSQLYILKIPNFCVKYKVSRKFFHETAKTVGILLAKREIPINSMWLQSIQCEFPNFLESYVSEFWRFPKEYFRNLPNKKYSWVLFIFIAFDFGTAVRFMPWKVCFAKKCDNLLVKTDIFAVLVVSFCVTRNAFNFI